MDYPSNIANDYSTTQTVSEVDEAVSEADSEVLLRVVQVVEEGSAPRPTVMQLLPHLPTTTMAGEPLPKHPLQSQSPSSLNLLSLLVQAGPVSHLAQQRSLS